MIVNRTPITDSLLHCDHCFRVRKGRRPSYFTVPKDSLLPLSLEWDTFARLRARNECAIPVYQRDLERAAELGLIRFMNIPIRVGTIVGAFA